MPKEKSKRKNNVYVYVPCGADINLSGKDMPPPKTKYERKKAVFDRDEIKKQLTKRDCP